jgi:uncharacterized protein (DUF2252 family)
MPLAAHAECAAGSDRLDPIEQLERQAEDRVPDLVPIRYGRMLTSPFAFYRGAAQIMATDLGGQMSSPLRAQLCGDAHLSNFGVFASPERRLVFDLNDFDETLPGPFEWDLKRLAASVEIAGRGNGFRTKQRRATVLQAVSSYRKAMGEFATQNNLAVWYAHVDVERLLADSGSQLRPTQRERTAATLAKARTRDSMQAFKKLTAVVDGRPRIVADPPLIVPVEDIMPEMEADQLYEQLRVLLRSYRRSLPPDRRHLFEQFELLQMARKVVGVGSVGTRAWILLMQGADDRDPLFLQAKQATTSVLAPYAGASKYRNSGQRVVNGQQLMQASSDIFLGWERTTLADGSSRDYYVRQLRDWKASAVVEQMKLTGLAMYARVCAWTLARAHARSGDRVAIAAYLGRKDTFDQAVADYASAYADQNERDYSALETALKTNRIEAISG